MLQYSCRFRLCILLGYGSSNLIEFVVCGFTNLSNQTVFVLTVSKAISIIFLKRREGSRKALICELS